ncbi:EpsG family protein [Flavobacterium sp. FlaQc-47]|uniref:EpsG family protein n=1 Tax=Flavobacterium sp. FlaQc-47 TaxID=3374180 RepID=UPI003756F85C
MGFYTLLLLILLSLLFISHKYPSREKSVSLTILFILILIGGFRDRIGLDYGNYIGWYNNGTRDDGFEFGFLAIMKVFRFLNLDYKFLFFFFSFFTYLFTYLAIRKYTEKSSISLALYFLIPVLFLCSFMYIRQCLSVAVAFYAFAFLLDKKYIIYFLWMVVGVSFHYSCLIPFVAFFVIHRWGHSIKNYHLYMLIGISFIMSRIGIIDLISLFLKDSHYLYYVSSKAIPVPLLKLLVINVMGLLIINYFSKKGFQYNYQRYLLLLYVCSILFLNIFSESRDLTRIYIYFRIFEVILVADIIRYGLDNRKLILIGFMCCFYILPYYRALEIDSESSLKDEFKFIPYKSLLLKE